MFNFIAHGFGARIAEMNALLIDGLANLYQFSDWERVYSLHNTGFFRQPLPFSGHGCTAQRKFNLSTVRKHFCRQSTVPSIPSSEVLFPVKSIAQPSDWPKYSSSASNNTQVF